MIKFTSTTTDKKICLSNLPTKYYILVDDKVNKELLYSTLEEEGYTWIEGKKPTEFKPRTSNNYLIITKNINDTGKKLIFWRDFNDTKDLNLQDFDNISYLFIDNTPPQDNTNTIYDIRCMVLKKIDLVKIVDAIKTLKVLNVKPCKLTTKGSDAPLCLNITADYDLIVISSGAGGKQGRVIIHHNDLHADKIFHAIVDVIAFTRVASKINFKYLFNQYFLNQDTGE